MTIERVRRRGGRGRADPSASRRSTIDDSGPGEVLVRVVASGVCHSDLWAIENGNWGAPFPMLLGHEGAGIVEAVGEGVGSAVGDPVVLAWAVPCGHAAAVPARRPRRCAHAWVQPPRDAPARDAAPLAGTFSLGTLATPHRGARGRRRSRCRRAPVDARLPARLRRVDGRRRGDPDGEVWPMARRGDRPGRDRPVGAPGARIAGAER